MDRKEHSDALWLEYKQSGSITVRNELILLYRHLVKQVAHRMGTSYRGHVDVDDILSFGTLGLIDAVDKYNPDRGVKFETYAYFRIKGAIIDQMRQQDWVPRSIREKAKKIEAAAEKLEADYGRQPAEAEIAAQLDVTLEELQKTLGELHMYTISSLDEQILDLISDEHYSSVNEENPVSRLEVDAVKETLISAMDTLSDKERSIVSLYYFDELTLKEIGAVLGISESRVSQLHTRSLQRLKSLLMKQKDLLLE